MVKVAAGLVVTVWKPSRVVQAAEEIIKKNVAEGIGNSKVQQLIRKSR
jgi:hypothetical protein